MANIIELFMKYYLGNVKEWIESKMSTTVILTIYYCTQLNKGLLIQLFTAGFLYYYLISLTIN